MMDKYYFYRKSDPLKEPIGVGRFTDSVKALTYFASKKDLTIDEFISLFELGKK